jgi:uncharacterized protein Smg (DUF494 family)
MFKKISRCWLAVLVALVFIGIAFPAYAQGPSGERAKKGLAFLAANNIPAQAFRDLSVAGGDPKQIQEALAKNGFTPEQIQNFMNPQNIMTMNQILNPNPAGEVLGKAVAAFGAYNLSQADLVAVLPLVSDPQKMMQALAQKGLNAEQITKLMGDVGPIIQEANASGVLKYAPTLIADQAYRQTGLCPAAGDCSGELLNIAKMLNDPEKMTEYLKGRGLSEAQIQATLQTTKALVGQGLSEDAIVGNTVSQALYRLEGLGLPAQELKDLVALGDLEAIKARLAEKGISGDMLDLAIVNLEGVLGEKGEKLSPETMEKFQADEALALCKNAGIDPSELGDILKNENDPEALKKKLADLGLNEEQSQAFMTGLEQSTFGKTVDPENAEEFLKDVEQVAQEQAEATEEPTGEEQPESTQEPTGEEQPKSEEQPPAATETGGDN